jgi:hypothetical protein
MLAFIPLLIPVCARLLPVLVGAGAGALTVAAVKGGDGKKEQIEALKDRIARLEQRDPK